MEQKIKVASVDYLNAKPLLWGLEREEISRQIDWQNDYPAAVAERLKSGKADIALMPVAAMRELPGSYIVGNHGIAAHGNVVSVALFSEVPLPEIKEVILDYQSRTSVRLAQLLLENFWHQKVHYLPASPDFISEISGTRAGVIIGDRALKKLPHFPYCYDLSKAWADWQQLPFVFAAWIATKPLHESFVQAFDAAQETGLKNLSAVIEKNPFPAYDLHTYYTQNIVYHLGEAERKGLQRFLQLIG